MLVQLVTALALLKVSTTVVDLIALYVKELRVEYKKAMIQETEDFSDLRDRRELEERNKSLSARPSVAKQYHTEIPS